MFEGIRGRTCPITPQCSGIFVQLVLASNNWPQDTRGIPRGTRNVALKTLCRHTAQCTKKGPVASSLEHQNDTFFLIERIVTTIFNCFSPCKCDDIVSRSSNNANTHSSEHSTHIRTKHMSTKHHGHLHAVYLVVSS